MGTIVKIFIFILLILGAAGAFVMYALGVFGSPKPKDLGIRYSQQDFEVVQKKSGVKYEDFKATPSTMAIKYSGEHEVGDKFTSEEVTAVANERAWASLPFSNVQIKVSEDRVEVSGNLDTSKVVDYLVAVGGLTNDEAGKITSYVPISGNPSFYIDAGGSVTNNDVDLRISSAKIGPVNIPSGLISGNLQRVDSFLDSRLNAFDGAYVKSFKLKDGYIDFSGKLPDTESLPME